MIRLRNKRDYPVDAFPEKIQWIINSFSESLNWPPEYTGSALLFATSVSAGNRFSTRVKYGWVEYPALYVFVIGHPGVSKTHAIKWPVVPINKRDKHYHKEYSDLLEKYEQATKMSPTLRKEAGMEAFSKHPTLRKHLVKDTTLEGLIKVLRDNKDGVGAIFDEATTWFKNLNRYSNGSDIGAWLSMWNQDDIVKDRAGSEAIRVDHPFVSIIGGIQPGILNDLSDQQMEENGMIDRILFAWPKNDVMQPIPREDISMAEQEKAWSSIIWAIMDYDQPKRPNFNCYQFVMTPEARDAYFDWDGQNIDQANKSEEVWHFGVASKMRSQVVRIATLIELMKYGSNQSPFGPGEQQNYDHEIISLESMESAIQLCEYYKYTARLVRDQLHNPNTLQDKPTNVKEFYNELPDEFSRKEAIEAGASFAISKRSIDRMLKDETLFGKAGYGTYVKIN